MIGLLAATFEETALLRRQLSFSPDRLFPGTGFICQNNHQKIQLIHLGVGMVSAAMALTRLLERCPPKLLIAFGCGGAYSLSRLKNGDLALASHEVFGDLGVAAAQKFIPLSELRLPLPEILAVQQQIVLHKGWQEAVLQSLEQADEFSDRRIMAGTFVSVNSVSGTPELSRALENCWEGICENMEGAALAQIAGEYGIPLIELRGISNPCCSRERDDWDLSAGMKVAQAAVLHILQDLPHIRNHL